MAQNNSTGRYASRATQLFPWVSSLWLMAESCASNEHRFQSWAGLESQLHPLQWGDVRQWPACLHLLCKCGREWACEKAMSAVKLFEDWRHPTCAQQKSTTMSPRSQTRSPPARSGRPVPGFIWPLVSQPCSTPKSCHSLLSTRDWASLRIPMPFTLLSILRKRNISLCPCLYQNWGSRK